MSSSPGQVSRARAWAGEPRLPHPSRGRQCQKYADGGSIDDKQSRQHNTGRSILGKVNWLAHEAMSLLTSGEAALTGTELKLCSRRHSASRSGPARRHDLSIWRLTTESRHGINSFTVADRALRRITAGRLYSLRRIITSRCRLHWVSLGLYDFARGS